MANARPVRNASAARLSRVVLCLALAIAFAFLQQPSSAQQSPDKPAEQDDVIRVTTNLISIDEVWAFIVLGLPLQCAFVKPFLYTAKSGELLNEQYCESQRQTSQTTRG